MWSTDIGNGTFTTATRALNRLLDLGQHGNKLEACHGWVVTDYTYHYSSLHCFKGIMFVSGMSKHSTLLKAARTHTKHVHGENTANSLALLKQCMLGTLHAKANGQ